MSSLSDAFAFFGTKLRNARLDLSTRSEADKTVVVALWRDRFDYSNRAAVTYSLRLTGQPAEWLDQPGNRARLEDLRWAREHCDGRFRVVVLEAADPAAEPRTVLGASPQQFDGDEAHRARRGDRRIRRRRRAHRPAAAPQCHGRHTDPDQEEEGRQAEIGQPLRVSSADSRSLTAAA
jgi:hypothetical protein